MVSNQFSDAELIAGLVGSASHREGFENALYLQFAYFMDEGKKKYNLTQEDVFSCYSDAVIKVIDNIRSKLFEGRSSIKTYLYQVFNNKCVDQIRKSTTKKSEVHHVLDISDHLYAMPDDVRTIIQQLVLKADIDQLRRRLLELGDNCRKMLLWFADGYSDLEISEKLRFKTAGVAKTSRLRCMERLRQLYVKG